MGEETILALWVSNGMANLFTIPASVNGRAGKTLITWHPLSTLLATVGLLNTVHIYHRSNKLIDSFPIPGLVFLIHFLKNVYVIFSIR